MAKKFDQEGNRLLCINNKDLLLPGQILKIVAKGYCISCQKLSVKEEYMVQYGLGINWVFS